MGASTEKPNQVEHKQPLTWENQQEGRRCSRDGFRGVFSRHSPGQGQHRLRTPGKPGHCMV